MTHYGNFNETYLSGACARDIKVRQDTGRDFRIFECLATIVSSRWLVEARLFGPTNEFHEYLVLPMSARARLGVSFCNPALCAGTGEEISHISISNDRKCPAALLFRCLVPLRTRATKRRTAECLKRIVALHRPDFLRREK